MIASITASITAGITTGITSGIGESVELGGAAPGTLAAVLERGPLTLGAALDCAADVAAELRDLHRQKLIYGMLNTRRILVTPDGAQLTPPPEWALGDAVRDVRAFGGVLYELVTGNPPPEGLRAAHLFTRQNAVGAAGVRAHMLVLAARCVEGSLTMQHALMEIRLRHLALRQVEAELPSGEEFPAGLDAESLAALSEAMEVPAAEVPAAEVATVRVAEEVRAAAPKVEALPAVGECPKCGNTPVYASRPRTSFEKTLARFRVPLCRCHRCRHRYLVVAYFRLRKSGKR